MEALDPDNEMLGLGSLEAEPYPDELTDNLRTALCH
jgi:hypothetical protein